MGGKVSMSAFLLAENSSSPNSGGMGVCSESRWLWRRRKDENPDVVRPIASCPEHYHLWDG